MKHPRRQSVAVIGPAPPEPFSRTALVIVAVAFVVRLVHIWQIRGAPFFTVLMGDARGYDAWAQRIAGGDWIGSDVFYQAPLYPYFLGIIYAIAGHNLLVVRIVQALLGSAACALVGAAAARLFSKREGLVAGLALALYAPAIFFDGLLQKSVLDVFFVSLALWLISRLIAAQVRLKPDTTNAPVTSVVSGFSRTWFFLGLAMGGLALTRENAMVLIAVILAWAIVGRATVGLTPDTTAVKAAAVFLAGLAIVLVPVAARNYGVTGGFYITTSQFGPNFYIGNNPRSNGSYTSLRYGRGSPEYERQDATELAERATGHALTPADVSSYWTGRALAFITSQPGAWLALMGRKVFLLWNADEMLDTESQETYAEWSLPLRVGGWVGHFGVLVPLALFGAWVTWPDRRRLWVFYVMIAVYSASVIMFYVFARYRFPLVPMLVPFAAAGLVEALELLRESRQLFLSRAGAPTPAGVPSRGARQLFPIRAGAPPPAPTAARSFRSRREFATTSRLVNTALAVTMVLAIVFTNWPVLSSAMMQAITENNLATAFQEEGRLDDAIAHYKRSVELQSDYAPAYNNMGVALRAKGDVDGALGSYERALAAEPDYADAHYNMANALLDKRRPEDAAEHFRIALKTNADSAGMRNNLGIALADGGKMAEAVEQFRAALAADPNSSKTNRNLGSALSSLGRHDEALAYLRKAVELDPNDPDAHYDLGGDLLERNELQAAAVEFEAALRLAPDSFEAHNNLGIALASQGRVDDAIEHFQQAIRLNPDFADARRNLQVAQAQKSR